MNVYGNLSEFKSRLQITGSGSDATLLSMLEVGSRWTDDYCKRHFYPKRAARLFDAEPIPGELPAAFLIDDLLSVETLKFDKNLDGTYEESWGASDYALEPRNTFPKFRVRQTAWGSYSVAAANSIVEITGLWGFGDGSRAAPWDAVDEVVWIDDTVLKPVAEAAIHVGDTLVIGEELLFVAAQRTAPPEAGAPTFTVVRAANGSELPETEHEGGAEIAVVRYPRAITQAAYSYATTLWREKGRAAGLQSERLGDYSYARSQTEWNWSKALERAISVYVR